MLRAAALLALVTAAVAAGCGAFAPSNALPACQPNDELACSEIHGFPLGRLADCTRVDAGCDEVFVLTRTALDRRDQGHARVVEVQKFEVDMARVCGPVLCVFSGYRAIALFTFADGSRRPIGYECPGIATCRATFEWGNYGDGKERLPPFP